MNEQIERRSQETTVNDGAGAVDVTADLDTDDYVGIIADYVIVGADRRARLGTVRAVWDDDGNPSVIDETSTLDVVATTDDIVFSIATSGTDPNEVVNLQLTNDSGVNCKVVISYQAIKRPA